MARKRRMNRKKKYILSLIATLVILGLIYGVTVLIRQFLMPADRMLKGPYDVVSVVDGDTIIIDLAGAETYVRFIGVDTPESVADETYKENTAEGAQATEYTRNILEGSTVYLEYDEERTDSYGRTLCYVYLRDKTTMVNELLLQNGYARTMTIEPNTRYRERLSAAEHQAKDSSAGFWATGFFN